MTQAWNVPQASIFDYHEFMENRKWNEMGMGM